MKQKKWIVLASVVAAGVIFDQLTKFLAHAELRGRGLVPVLEGFLELHYVRNPGAFFSMGADLTPDVRRTLFVLASLIASALMVRLYARATEDQRALRWALILLLGGALGNLIDRVLYGEVIDFVHLYYRGVFDWATFNVADVLITAGLVLLVVDLVRPRREAATTSARTAEQPAPIEPDDTKRALHTETTP